MATKICPRCKKEMPNVGPWKDDPEWPELCGSCKVHVALAKPGVKERLRLDVLAAALQATRDEKGN